MTMNPNRHHEYIGSKEEQLPATYFNRMEEICSHSSYFPQDGKRQDTISTDNNVTCRCSGISSNITCKLCRTGVPTESSWNIVVPVQCENFQYTDPQGSHRQSPIYMHTNLPTRLPYLSKPESNENIISTDKKRIIINMPSNGNCAIETSYNSFNSNQMRHPAQMQHNSMATQNVTPIATYYKERPYTDNCSPNPDLNVGSRIAFSSVAIPNSSVVCNQEEKVSSPTEAHCPASQRNKHIVSYNNVRNLSEKNPSPNYPRQCPQVFSTTEANSAHVSLYVSTPQFSSEKFTMVPTQSPISLSNTQLQRKSNLDQCRGSHNSSMLPSHAENKNHSHQINDIMQSQNVAQRTMCRDYYDNPSEDQSPVGPPVMKQSKHHPHFQYSKSTPMSTSVACVVAPKSSSSDIVDYVRKENTEYYNSTGPEFERDYYVNLYNAPPSSDPCYKGPYPAYASPGYREDYAKGYHRFVKPATEKPLPINEFSKSRALSTSRDPNLNVQSNCCKPQQRGVEGIIKSTGMASSVETSSSMGQLPPKLQHVDYSSPMQHMQSCNSVAALGNDDQSSYKPPKLSSKVSCINMSGKIQSLTVQLTPPSKQPMYPSKRSQVVKPNYKELINQVYAMRNSTSEEELNLKIIRKTLNVDTQPSRALISSASDMDCMPQLLDLASQNNQLISNPASKRYCDASVPEAPSTKPKTSFVVESVRQSSKLGEKSNLAPLDLSMRTVKTKADSTEYKYSQQSASSKIMLASVRAPALPRVDFTPNFSLHTSDEVHLKTFTDARQKPVDRQSQSKCLTLHQSPNIRNAVDLPKPLSSVPTATLPVQNLATIQQHALSTDVALKTTHLSFSKSAPHPARPVVDAPEKCVRPTVLETNTHAVTKTHFTHKLTNRSMPTVDHGQYDVISPVQSASMATVNAAPSGVRAKDMPLYPPSATAQAAAPLSSNQVQSQAPISEIVSSAVCQRNLPQKRHLQELPPCVQPSEGPLSKKSCYEELPLVVTPIRLSSPNPPTAQAECARKDFKISEDDSNGNETFDGLQNHIDHLRPESTARVIQPTVSVLKTSTKDAIIPFTSIKTEPNSNAHVARIRTKAELKGFTFPLNPESSHLNSMAPHSYQSAPTNGDASIKEDIKIKEEYPEPPSSSDVVSATDMAEQCCQAGVLDFNWNATCNDFMEQLMLSSRTAKSPPPPLPSVLCSTVSTAVKFEPSGEDSAITMRSFSMSQDTVSTSKMPAQKKTNKLDREKMRLQQEARIAARLQDDTSSESDNEMEKRKTERLKKPMKRTKSRYTGFAFANANGNGNETGNRFSECGSDSTTESVLFSNKMVKNLKNYKERIIGESSVNANISSERGLPSAGRALSSSQSCHLEELEEHPDGSCDDGDCKSKGFVVKHKTDDPYVEDDNVPARASIESHDDVGGDTKTAPTSSNHGSGAIMEREKGEEKRALSSKDVDDAASIMHTKSDDERFPYKDKDEEKAARLEKPIKREKSSAKIELNTMTRSKRKLALELQLANSKVLRNDKIIGNATTKNKRKYIRKYTNSQNVDIKDAALLSCNTDNVAGTLAAKRLRSRDDSSTKQSSCNQKPVGANRKRTRCNSKASDSSIEIGKDHQAIDLLMEMYRYKRSLKIPPSLISIKHPSNDKIAAELPDLEHDAYRRSSSYMRHRAKSRFLLKSQSKSELSEAEGPRSIIDYLHSRLKTSNKAAKSTPPISHNAVSCSMSMCSESGQNDETDVSSTSLPTPKAAVEESGSGKKRHFSIFETKVLKTKTRTESKLQQKREIIREIFVGDDRAASAPPDMIMAIDNCTNMTYEQKYEQFLHQMNVEFDEDKLSKFGRTKTSILPFQAASLLHNKEELTPVKPNDMAVKEGGNSQRDNIAVMLRMAPNKFRRRRSGKYLRRKGSSGFDYIRKKKKTTPSTLSNHQSVQVQSKVDQQEDEDSAKVKTEMDVCREIQKWVLNKGVGQSAMHKAARLGYIDVVVYCLDRMDLNPDQKDNAGYTPLHEACTNGRLEIARLLLQYGANHSEAAHSGIRPLHEACENDHEEIVRLLLSYGADPLLATYSGQTPMMLASSGTMKQFLLNHLSDVQSTGNDRKPWSMTGQWELYDPTECGYDILAGAPNMSCDMSKALRKSLVSNIFNNRRNSKHYGETSCKSIMSKCAVVLDNIHGFNSIRLYNNAESDYLIDNSDSDGDIFEFEEADVLLPPLYLLKDEGTAEKWVLLNDLCNLLKVKSKDTLLNKIQPSSSMPSPHKSLMRELKMSDFLEKATCLQLLCAGEKINICASKVVLIKYNESVKNLLGVKTILMKF